MPETRGRATGNSFLTREGTGRERRKSCSMLKEMDTVTGELDATETGTSSSEGGGQKRTVFMKPPEVISGKSEEVPAPRWPATLLLTGHRSLLSTALCVLHYRIAVTQGDPRRRDTISG